MSKRLIIFSDIEKNAFYEIPSFDHNDRTRYFNFTEEELSLIRKSQFIHLNVFCALQIGYFKAVHIFNPIGWEAIEQKDVSYIIEKYFKNTQFVKHNITEYEYYTQRKAIATLYGYYLWRTKLSAQLTAHTKEVIKQDVSVHFIGRALLEYLEKEKIIRPGYTTLQSIVSAALTIERHRLSAVIDQNLDDKNKQTVTELLLKEDGISRLAALHQDAKNFGFKMMSKERLKHKMLQSLYGVAQQVITSLNISQQNIKYYADLATYYNSRDLLLLSYNQSYLYILCYISRRYKEINDNLVEAFRYNTKKMDEGIRAKVKKAFQEEKSDTQKKIGRLLLLYVKKSIKDEVIFQKVRGRAFNIMDKEIIEELGNKFWNRGHHKKEYFWNEVDTLQKSYQRTLRPFFTSLEFTSQKRGAKWIMAINWLKTRLDSKEKTSKEQPVVIPKYLQKYFIDKDQNFNINRYEYWLYTEMEARVKVGEVYIEHSILHNCFNEELVPVEKSKEVEQELGLAWSQKSLPRHVEELLKYLDLLWIKINEQYAQGFLKHLKYDDRKKKFVWSKVRSEKNEELQHNFYSQLPFSSINEIINFVDQKTGFLAVLTPLQDRYHKTGTISNARKAAAILSKALNYGDYKMSQSSDISYRELKTTSSQILRLSTLREANDIVSNAISELPIYPHYSIDLKLLFSSVDGQKYELDSPNIKARFSKKYLKEKPGVSAYSIFANHIPFNSYTIGSNEHESYHVFDIWYNNSSNIDAQIITGDMHSQNKANFAILHWFGVQYKPRFTSLNAQLKRIYCSKNLNNYKNYILAPAGVIDDTSIIRNDKQTSRIIATLGSKDMNQANLVKKLCNLPSEDPMRKGVFEFDRLVRSIYTLEYMMDFQLQRKVGKSQNRIEAYHQLRAAIAKIGGKKQLYGKTNTDIEISNQCGRLIANIVIYYNSLILSMLLEQNPEFKKNLKLLKMFKKISPIAWEHIHFHGQYTFKNDEQFINLAEILKDIKLEF